MSRAVLLTALWATLLCCAQVALAGDVTVLVGATVIDATGQPTVEDAAVLIDGDRISAVGPRSEIAIPEGATVLDVKGKWIVPGLGDPHIHFFQSGSLYTRPDVIDLRSVRSYEAEIEGIRSRMDGTFRRYLASGVTAVVDVGGPMWNFDVRQEARDAELAPFVSMRHGGFLRTLTVREGKRTGDRMVELTTTGDAETQMHGRTVEAKAVADAFLECMRASGVPLTSIYWTQHRAVKGERTTVTEHHLHGESVLHEELCLKGREPMRF